MSLLRPDVIKQHKQNKKQFFTEVPVNIWKNIYIRVFVKTTLGIDFHYLDPTFINAYIVKLLQTWITLDKPF